jgi:hypothetical protein
MDRLEGCGLRFLKEDRSREPQRKTALTFRTLRDHYVKASAGDAILEEFHVPRHIDPTGSGSEDGRESGERSSTVDGRRCMDNYLFDVPPRSRPVGDTVGARFFAPRAPTHV